MELGRSRWLRFGEGKEENEEVAREVEGGRELEGVLMPRLVFERLEWEFMLSGEGTVLD